MSLGDGVFCNHDHNRSEVGSVKKEYEVTPIAHPTNRRGLTAYIGVGIGRIEN